MAQLPAQDQTFFNDDLLTRARFLVAANQTAHNLALAARDTGDKAAHLNAARAAAAQMQSALAPAQHGPFDDLVWKPDRIFGIKDRVNDIKSLDLLPK